MADMSEFDEALRRAYAPALEKAMEPPPVWFDLVPTRPPLTRRQRLYRSFRGYRRRVVDAWAVLRGRAFIGDDW